MNSKITIIAFVALLMGGCVATTVNVTDRKPVSRPFSRILCFYLEEGCDFSLFDSTLYNICLRNHTRPDSGYADRSNQESIIAEKLSTVGTAVWASSYWLDPARSSYAEFLHYIDSMKVDALLIVGVRSYLHPSDPDDASTVTNLHGTFRCDLFATRTLIAPVWRAEIVENGQTNNSKKGLTRKLVHQVVESLKSSQYIAH